MTGEYIYLICRNCKSVFQIPVFLHVSLRMSKEYNIIGEYIKNKVNEPDGRYSAIYSLMFDDCCDNSDRRWAWDCRIEIGSKQEVIKIIEDKVNNNEYTKFELDKAIRNLTIKIVIDSL